LYRSDALQENGWMLVPEAETAGFEAWEQEMQQKLRVRLAKQQLQLQD
jgi:hypothetical protein